MDLLPRIKRPATLPTAQQTTTEYKIALMKILRSCVKVGRSRMSRMGCEFWSWGSLMNHIAPGRNTARHPDRRTAKEYLKQELTTVSIHESNVHEHGSGNPMIEHSREWRLSKECNTRLKIRFRKKPDCAKV